MAKEERMKVTLEFDPNCVDWRFLEVAAAVTTDPDFLERLLDFVEHHPNYKGYHTYCEAEPITVFDQITDNLYLSEKNIRKLAENEDECARGSIAHNPNTPEDVLQKLVEDSDDYVVRYLLQNPKLPPKIANRAVERVTKGEVDDVVYDIEKILCNPSLSTENYKKLSEWCEKEYPYFKDVEN